MDDKYNPKDYQKTIYTFKPNELAKLMPWDAQVQLGAVAERVLAGMLRSECLKRVGVKQSPDVGVDYNMITEQFTVYVPKIWCSACQNKRAEFEYSGKPYCKNCAEVLKEQLTKQPPPIPKKKVGKKK